MSATSGPRGTAGLGADDASPRDGDVGDRGVDSGLLQRLLGARRDLDAIEDKRSRKLRKRIEGCSTVLSDVERQFGQQLLQRIHEEAEQRERDDRAVEEAIEVTLGALAQSSLTRLEEEVGAMETRLTGIERDVAAAYAALDAPADGAGRAAPGHSRRQLATLAQDQLRNEAQRGLHQHAEAVESLSVERESRETVLWNDLRLRFQYLDDQFRALWGPAPEDHPPVAALKGPLPKQCLNPAPGTRGTTADESTIGLRHMEEYLVQASRVRCAKARLEIKNTVNDLHAQVSTSLREMELALEAAQARRHEASSAFVDILARLDEELR